MGEMRNVTDKAEIKRLLRAKGSKVAVQCGFEGPFVYVEKTDFVREILDRDNGHTCLTNYDGDTESAAWHNGVLSVPIGVN